VVHPAGWLGKSAPDIAGYAQSETIRVKLSGALYGAADLRRRDTVSQYRPLRSPYHDCVFCRSRSLFPVSRFSRSDSALCGIGRAIPSPRRSPVSAYSGSAYALLYPVSRPLADYWRFSFVSPTAGTHPRSAFLLSLRRLV